MTIGAGVGLVAALAVLPVLIELFGAPPPGSRPLRSDARQTRSRSRFEPTVLILADFLDSLLHGAVLVGLCLTLTASHGDCGCCEACPPASRPSSAPAACGSWSSGRSPSPSGQSLPARPQSRDAIRVARVGCDRRLRPDRILARRASARAALALGLAAAARSLRRAPGAAGRWAMAGLIAVALAGSSAWLTHRHRSPRHTGDRSWC